MFCEYVSRTVEIRQAKYGEPANRWWAPQAGRLLNTNGGENQQARTRRKWALSTLAERKSVPVGPSSRRRREI